MTNTESRDGIEIHFDEKRGVLGLACEPDAFQRYLEVARQDMEAIPKIDMSKVVELHITDTATFVARHEARRPGMWDVLFPVILFAILSLASFGTYVLISKLF